MEPELYFFPVGNGDTTLIKLGGGENIIIDCNISLDSQDPAEQARYDVRRHLLDDLRRDDKGRPHVDVFILSHPDADHCRGFEKVFFCGNPDEYAKKDEDEDRIIIDELWFAPRIFAPHESDLCDDAKALRDEAKRRIKLYRKGVKGRSLPGNRLRIIGYSDNPDIQGLEEVLTVPGNEVNLINNQKISDFSFFVHGPMKKDTDDHWAERNDTSIILQARFDIDDKEHAVLVLLGGDAGCALWENIAQLSEEVDLSWDILLAPHHCSRYFFNEDKEDEETCTPTEEIVSLLDLRCEGAWVISSSKPIKDDDDNPPHHIAAEIYREYVGRDRFLCTGEYPLEKSPLPIRFTMSSNGPVKNNPPAGRRGAITNALNQPTTYGCW
jgi:hypothetical protein